MDSLPSYFNFTVRFRVSQVIEDGLFLKDIETPRWWCCVSLRPSERKSHVASTEGHGNWWDSLHHDGWKIYIRVWVSSQLHRLKEGSQQGSFREDTSQSVTLETSVCRMCCPRGPGGGLRESTGPLGVRARTTGPAGALFADLPRLRSGRTMQERHLTGNQTSTLDF